MAERYGGKWTLGIGLLSTAIFTLLTPVVVKAGGATWLFILRVLQGMGEVCTHFLYFEKKNHTTMELFGILQFCSLSYFQVAQKW